MSKASFISRFKPGSFPDDKVEPVINEALNDRGKLTSAMTRQLAARSLHATSNNLFKALDDDFVGVRESAASNPNATKAHLDKAMQDHHYVVRETVVNNPNATKEHIDKALKDVSSIVRDAVVSRKPIKPTKWYHKIF